jgi:hypothetical protein
VPGGKAGQRGQASWGAAVVPGQPLVEQAQGDADAACDGGCGAVGGYDTPGGYSEHLNARMAEGVSCVCDTGQLRPWLGASMPAQAR